MTRNLSINRDFTCMRCHNYVSAEHLLSGVHHRNHCPYCLWSRHLDLHQAGDRLAACKALMRPVGLTLKRSHKKYASCSSGELMLVHQCTECEQVSINRIAADDLSPLLLDVLTLSFEDHSPAHKGFRQAEIFLLQEENRDLVYRQLYGESFIPA